MPGQPRRRAASATLRATSLARAALRLQGRDNHTAGIGCLIGGLVGRRGNLEDAP